MPYQDARAYSAARFMLQLDGATAGSLASAEGGLAVADVVEEKLGPDQVVRKHIAQPKYTDIQLGFGPGMSPNVYQWITDTLDHKHLRKSGVVVTSDYDLKERERLTFTNALISRVDFPALTAAAKDSAKLTLSLAPEVTKREKGSGTKVSYPVDAKGQTRWLPADFKLEIAGLDCTGVSMVEPISIRVVMVEDAVGEMRDYQKAPAHIELSDLVVTLTEAKADLFYAWHEDFVIKGNNTENYEKSGKLEFRSPAQTALFTLSFAGLGIYKLASTQAAGPDAIRRVTASMYCQEMAFSLGSGAPAAPVQPPAPPPSPSGETPSSEQSPGSSELTPVVLSGDYPGRFTRIRTTV